MSIMILTLLLVVAVLALLALATVAVLQRRANEHLSDLVERLKDNEDELAEELWNTQERHRKAESENDYYRRKVRILERTLERTELDCSRYWGLFHACETIAENFGFIVDNWTEADLEWWVTTMIEHGVRHQPDFQPLLKDDLTDRWFVTLRGVPDHLRDAWQEFLFGRYVDAALQLTA